MSAIGHRVVHGGADFDQAVLVDDAVMAKLRLLEPLAPLHHPHILAGIGEHSMGVRRQILQSMAWLGIELDEHANQAVQTIISTARSRVLCLRIPTNKEIMVARHTQALVKRLSVLRP